MRLHLVDDVCVARPLGDWDEFGVELLKRGKIEIINELLVHKRAKQVLDDMRIAEDAGVPFVVVA